MTERPPSMILLVGGFLIVASMLVFGALWSGSAQGHAFAEAATSSYESGWLPWAGVAVGIGCGAGMLFGFAFARWLFVAWMGWGVIEGLLLLDKPYYSLPALAAYAVIALLLFLPSSNDWFRKA